MRYSQMFGKTNKTAKELDSVNATLLQKAGYIHQEMAGVYTFLPLGLRVLANIEQIIREEMNQIASEVLMPAIVPQQLWDQTGRKETVDVLFQVSGANKASRTKNDAVYILNSTHEEVVTPIAKETYFSYKDFPFAVYQIQTKFRNEARPKSGLMRGREFRMKDLYSFHTDEADLKRYYELAKTAYTKVYQRLGLGELTVIAQASGGDFTKDYSHEFQVRCESGEDLIFLVPSTGEAFNREVAPAQAPTINQDQTENPLQEVYGENIVGVDDLVEFLKVPAEKTTKTLIFEVDGERIIAAAVRGNYEINMEKLLKVVGGTSLKLASPDVVKKATGAEVGYAGILNLPDFVELYLDDSLRGQVNFECGANKTNYHLINVNFGRDLPEPEHWFDFKLAQAGDHFPGTGEKYEVFKASEVGNIFPLNTKFSKAINYTYTDAQGQDQFVYMGCYGIGPSRILGVMVEVFHDEKGITWPKSVAPFQVHLVSLPGVETEAEELYQRLSDQKIEVLWDDRSVSAGQKFADADLIGIPVRLVLSKKTNGQVEWKERTIDTAELIDIETCLHRLKI